MSSDNANTSRRYKSTQSQNSFIGNFLKSIDNFAVTFNFRVDKKPKYGSVLGGMSFIFFVIFALLYTTKRLYDYISWTDTKIQFIDKSIYPSPALNFKKMNFSYAIKVTFENDTAVWNSSLSDLFIIQQNYVFKNSTYSSKNLNLPRRCSDQDFYGKSNDYPIFQKDSIENFGCFDIYDNYTLQGTYTDANMTYIEILLKINDTYLSDYSNLKKIFDKDSFKFSLFYIDTFNDVSDYKNPVFYEIDAIYTYLDLGYFKRNNINFQRFNYSSDKNLFYNHYKHETYMKLFSSQEIMSPITDRETSSKEEKAYLNKFFLRVVNNERTVKLSFVKIPEFLASLSGLLVNMLIIIKIFMTAWNFLQAKQTIMSKIMKYKDVLTKTDKSSLNYLEKKFKNANKDLNKDNYSRNNMNQNPNFNIMYGSHVTLENSNGNLSPLQIRDPGPSAQFLYSDSCYVDNPIKNTNNIIKVENEIYKNSRSSSLDYQNNQNANSKTNNENNLSEKLNETFQTEISDIQEIKENRNPYLLKFSDFCKAIFCCKFKSKSIKKKINIFKNAQMKFNYNLDLVTYMKKMQEIEILKYLILDKDTIHLMNFISKPSISLTNTSIKDEEYQLFFENLKKTNSISNQKIDTIKTAFDNLMARPNHNDVEKRILKLFNLQIQEILN